MPVRDLHKEMGGSREHEKRCRRRHLCRLWSHLQTSEPGGRPVLLTVGGIINFVKKKKRVVVLFWKPELLLRRDSALESRDSEIYSKTSRAHSWSVVVTISFYIIHDRFATSTSEGQRKWNRTMRNERKQKSSKWLQAGVLVLFCVWLWFDVTELLL